MPTQIIRELVTDVVKRGTTRAVYAKQNDLNSRFFNVIINEEGKKLNISPESTVTLNVERSDNQRNSFYGTVNEDGTVQVPLTSWMLEIPGTLSCDISIIKEVASEDGNVTASKLTTMKFNIYVEDAVNSDETIQESEEYSVVVDLLARTTKAAEIAEGAERSATEAARQAETLKEACEDATQNANEAAEYAHAARNELEAGGFINSLKEQHKGGKFSFWVGTKEEYDAIEKKTNGCLYILTDDNPADYVVEQGTQEVNGMNWFYRKWNSGLAECWGRRTFQYIPDTAWAIGAFFTTVEDGSNAKLFRQSFPPIFEFVDDAHIEVAKVDRIMFSTIGLLYPEYIGFFLLSTQQTDIIQEPTITISAKGRWK